MLKGADNPDITCLRLSGFSSDLKMLTIACRRRKIRLLVPNRNQRRRNLHLPSTSPSPPITTIPLSQLWNFRQRPLSTAIPILQHLGTEKRGLICNTEGERTSAIEE